jgi:hypothetical protein
MHRTHTKHRAVVRYLLGACAISLCAAVIFVQFGIQSPAMESPEVKFADTSKSGLSIVPASCPSSVHYEGECDPGTCTISSSPQSIMYGQGSTISWNHQGYVTGPWGGGPIDGWSVTAIGSIDNGIGGVGQSGATGVAPGSSVTYTYSGTYYYLYPWYGTWIPLASFSCSTPVYVSYYPATCSVWVDANPIGWGGGTTLYWNSSYADHWLYINNVGYVGGSGAIGVSPTVSTDYSCYAYGLGGSDGWHGLTLYVNQPPAASCGVSFSKNPVAQGDSSYVSWWSSNAHYSVYINNVGYVAGSGGGWVTPSGSTRYVDYSCYANGVGGSDGWHGAYLYVDRYCPLPWGGTIAHNQSVTAYSSPSVPYGSSCVAQTRSCSNGTLSGSYGHATCSADNLPTPSCTISVSPSSINSGDGASVSWSSSNAGNWFYINNIGYVGSFGTGIGVWPANSTTYSGSANGPGGTVSCGGAHTLTVYQSCALPWGGSTPNGTSVTAYQSSTVPWNTSCVSQTRSCSNGTLSGSYVHQACSPSQPADCSSSGTTIPHGSTQTLYSSQIAPTGQECSSITESRTCNNGILSGSDTYQYNSCTCAPIYSCSGDTIMYTDTNCSTTVYALTAPSCPAHSSCVPGQSSCIYPNISYGTLNGVSGDITARPIVVPEGESTNLYWNVQNAQSCTISGGGQTWTVPTSGLSGIPTAPITQRTVYTLLCTGYPNTTPATVSGTVIVNLLPTFRER